MPRAGIYNRCSTEEEAQINALETQASESREIVLAKGWTIADQYIESESGTTSYKRSEYQRLLEDMETDKFDIVVIKSIDRLMRSAKDWYLFLDRLTQNKKQLYIYIDNKFYTPDDSLIAGIKAILAEDFSRELSKKIKNAHSRRQNKQSGWNITAPMFGWDKVGKDEFVINEREAESYRLAFELAREGMGFHRIAKIMYERGARSKRGKRLDGTQWRNMLYSSRAHGTVILHTTEYDFEAKKKVKLPESEWIYVENALPPIVSKEYQTEVLQALLVRKQKDNPTRGFYARTGKPANPYELSGMLYCAECGSAYYRVAFASGEGMLNEWKCSTMLHQGRKSKDNPCGCDNINVIEDVVIEKIAEIGKSYYAVLFGPDEHIIEEAMTAIRKVLQQNKSGKELSTLKKELKKMESKKKVLLQKLVDEVIDDADFKIANLAITEDLEQTRRKISNIMIRSDEYNSVEDRLHKMNEALQGGVLDKAKTKEIISRIDKIVIHPNNRMEIFFNKLKIASLLQKYGVGFADADFAEKYFHILVDYEHKTNIVRRREKIKKQILEIFEENPNLMLKEVPEMVGMGESYVNSAVKELKETGLLRYERNGNTHTGKWIVTEKFV